ncbi:MAG TPA: M56 family metallopeptidase [Actinomycetota bacterium]|nr:M56 family metallopeptidase [Actinomycetota bacterium]
MISASPTILAVEVDSAWVVVLVVSLTTLLATALLRRFISRPGGVASGLLLSLPLLLPIVAAAIYQGGVLPEVTVLKPISSMVQNQSESLLHLLFLSDGNGQAALYAFYGSAGAWIFLIGLAVSSFMLVRRACGALVLRRLISRCTAPNPERDAQVLLVLDHLAIAVGLGPAPDLLILPSGVSGAFAVGLRRGRILLSRDLVDRLDDDELAAVLAHEIAHLRARDVPVMFAAGFLRDFVAWNPFAHVAFRRLLRDREFEADRRAASLTRNPLALASGLLTVCELMRGQRNYVRRGALAILRPQVSVTRRVRSLLAMADEGMHVDAPIRGGTFLIAALLVALLGLEAAAKLAADDSTWAVVWGNTSTPADAHEWQPAPSEPASKKKPTKAELRKIAKAKKASSVQRLMSKEALQTLVVSESNEKALSWQVYRHVNRIGVPASEFQLRARPVPLWSPDAFGVYKIDQQLLGKPVR